MKNFENPDDVDQEQQRIENPWVFLINLRIGMNPWELPVMIRMPGFLR